MLREIAFDYEYDSNGSAKKPSSFLKDLRGLESIKTSSIYPRGAVLFAEGQRPRGVYILCEGRAKISVASAEGKTLVLKIAGPGDVLGLNSALTENAALATAETIDRCRIDFVSREDFVSLLEGDRKSYLDIARALSQELSGLMDHTRLLLLSDSAAEKLAKLLLNWSDVEGKRTPQGTQIVCGLTHAELAQLICTSRETVTRILGDFQRAGTLVLTGGVITVRNRRALELLVRN
ncbi:MAG TPA: Crp/Fnr family transcriptional regulator [Pyrinomonadaceae bacterium]|nr:Crp/Fnr family transcriptional regulator [Pyrinomonadaceae bacterium]